MGVWRHWASMFFHDLRAPIAVCSGCFRLIERELDHEDGAESGAKLAALAREGSRASTRLTRLFASWYDVFRSSTVEEIVKALAVGFGPGVRTVVSADSQNIAIPNDDIVPVLWIIIQSQVLSAHAKPVDATETLAFIKVDVDQHGYCRIVVGPDEQERGAEWKDVTEEACEGDWLGAAADDLRAGGQEIRVRSNGPLAEVTLRWRCAWVRKEEPDL